MTEMDEEYRKHVDILISARTEQLRAAMTAMEKLSAALKPFLPDVVEKVREDFEAANKQIASQ